MVIDVNEHRINSESTLIQIFSCDIKISQFLKFRIQRAT